MSETDWYAPNQQAVRADGSGPAEEGSGGSTPETSTKPRKSKAAATPAPEPAPDGEDA